MRKRAGVGAALVLLSVLLGPPAAGQQQPARWFSGVGEFSTTNYFGFKHRHQHRSFGALGGVTQSFEMACGMSTQNPTEERFVANNVLAQLDPAFAPDSWVEMAAIYICGPDGVFRRLMVARATRNNVRFGDKAEPILDVGVEHEYAIQHGHSGPGCGSQPPELAWVHYLDGVKFSCAGFQAYTTHAPHSFEGDYFLETNDNFPGFIKARHHYLSAMRLHNGTSWTVSPSGWDGIFRDYPPAGGTQPRGDRRLLAPVRRVYSDLPLRGFAMHRTVAVAALGLVLFVVACGDNVAKVADAGDAPPSAEELAALQQARDRLESLPDPMKVVAERGCQTTSVGAYNAADGGTSPIVNLDEAIVVWACDFDVVFTGPPALGPPNRTTPPWPAEGVPRIARLVLLPSGGWQTRYFEQEPPALS